MQQEVPNGRMTEAYRRMEHYYSLAQWSACPMQRWRYENLMMTEVRRFLDLSRKEQRALTQVLQQGPPPLADQPVPPRTFTLAELGQYDGAGGRPAYVAVNGVVYDVSREATWGGATHFGLYAGRDLTAQFAGCHAKAEILQNLPKVGVLV